MSTESKVRKFWMSSNPRECDVCHVNIKSIFVDGNTSLGGWANMCPSCHKVYGRGLGIGKGQKYKLDKTDGKFYLTEGGFSSESD